MTRWAPRARLALAAFTTALAIGCDTTSQNLPRLEDPNNHFDLVLGVRNADAGDSVVDGRRVTYVPDRPNVRVWYFGGSTMYGIGQRPAHTIPSEIARLAERDGIRIEGLNFGVPADVNWQETIRFAEALASDLPRPDLVVFYDGVNDRTLEFLRSEWGDTDPSVSRRQPVSDRERRLLLDRANGRRTDPSTARALEAAQYGRGVRTALALAAPDDLPVVHFWQPHLATRTPLGADAELAQDLGLDPADQPNAVADYRELAELSGAHPVDLSQTFDDVEGPIFIDVSHTNERGALLVATAMYADLHDRLRTLSDGAR